MEKQYVKGDVVVSVKYGQQPDIKGEWKDIVKTSDIKSRMEKIDNLVELLSDSSASNGFFAEGDIVDCGKQHGFVMDDKELYYMFFDNLKILYDKYKDNNYSDGKFINQAIRATVLQYAGSRKVDRQKRTELTERALVDGDIVYPSISKQRGENCFYCTEYAAVSHNLWLLSGVTSYFCFTNSDEFGASDETYKNDTHNFTIVEYDGRYRLYDMAMNNYCELSPDCIKKMLTGSGLRVQDVENPGVYVSADCAEQHS